VFATVRHFRPSLIYSIKAGAYLPFTLAVTDTGKH